MSTDADSGGSSPPSAEAADSEQPDGWELNGFMGLIIGAFSFHIATYISTYGPINSPLAVIGIVSATLSGLLGMTLVIVDIDMEKWGREVGLGFLLLLLLSSLGILAVQGFPWPNSDIRLFSIQAVDGLLHGTNPYTMNLLKPEVYQEFHVASTKRVSGNYVGEYSYPAGMLLMYVPEAVLSPGTKHLLTGVVLFAVAGALGVYDSPNKYGLVIPAIFVSATIFRFGVSGANDATWVLPTMLAIRYWNPVDKRHLAISGVFFGIACSIKQMPWVMAPFLVLWLFRMSDSIEQGVRRNLRFGGIASVIFIVVNLPFFITAPEAYLQGAFMQIFGIGAPVVGSGMGLIAISEMSAYVLPHDFYSIALLLGLVGLSVTYWVHFEQVKWMAWLMHAPVLFFHSRSILHYFFVPMLIAGYIWVLQRRDDEPLPPLESVQVIKRKLGGVA